jgi:hypothetical protein
MERLKNVDLLRDKGFFTLQISNPDSDDKQYGHLLASKTTAAILFVAFPSVMYNSF